MKKTKTNKISKRTVFIRVLIALVITAATAATVYYSLKLSFSIAHALFGEHVGLEAALPDGDQHTTAQYLEPEGDSVKDPDISFPMIPHDSQVTLGWVQQDQIRDDGLYLDITDYDSDLCKLYVRVANHTAEEVSVAGSYFLYYEKNGAWVELTAPSEDGVTLFPLAADSSLDAILPLRKLGPFEPGSYRLVLSDLEVRFRFEPAE